ncbi:MAG TPA: TadE/TadG family type IV pilus assembly protein [Terracidiphilus sp.]|nr:TadE/TadG family type IV pilus assembly protein [Terracidiphilus sp.]
MIDLKIKSPRGGKPALPWWGDSSRRRPLKEADGRRGAGHGSRKAISEEGAAVVEMALSSMVLLSMLLGIIQMSLALYTYHFISEAAREGARYAIVRGSACTSVTNCNATSAQIQTYVQGLAFPGISSTQYMTVTTTWLSASTTLPTSWTSCGATQCNDPGNAVQVKVSYAFPLMLPFVSKSTLTMNSTSQMAIAN